MKRILITGGAGFIGSNLAKKLLEDNDNRILIADNLTTGRYENLPEHKNLIFIEGSIGCAAFCSSIFQYFKPDYIIHAAASYRNPDDWHGDSITNVIGTINILNEAKKHNVKKIIYPQTSLCYGKPLEQPIKIGHPLFSGGYDAVSSYASSKTCAEQYIKISGINFLILRLANIYGGGNLSGALPTFFLRIKNNQPITIINARRDFVYIEDLTNLIIKSFDEKYINEYGYFHVSSGSDYSIKEIFDTMIEIMGIERPKDVTIYEVGVDDVSTILIDPSLTEKTFEWKATHKDLKYNILQTIKWYEKNNFSETFTHLKIK